MEICWGFIGAGNVTTVRASPVEAFTQAGSRVVAVCRSHRALAEDYARSNGVAKAYTDVEQLCADPEVNAVYICTPHHLHRDHAMAALRAGKHVLCEKPLANSTEECKAMVQEARRAAVFLGVAYYRRFYPVIEALRQVLISGRLGRLTSAQVVKHDYFVPPRDKAISDGRTQWRTTLALAGGGTLNEAGCHRLDLLLYLLGDARSVSAELARFEAWYEGEDQASVTIRFANEVIAQVDHSWCNRSNRDFFAVAGTDGQVVIENLEENQLILQIGRETKVVEVAPRPQATHRAVVADFVQALNDGGNLRCPGEDGLRATQLIELAYRAARERRTVDVPSLVLSE